MLGTVKWYDPKRGEGFIQRDEGPDVHVPESALSDAEPGFLVEGQTVEFEMFAIPGGLRARDVRVVGAGEDWPHLRERPPVVRRPAAKPPSS